MFGPIAIVDSITVAEFQASLFFNFFFGCNFFPFPCVCVYVCVSLYYVSVLRLNSTDSYLLGLVGVCGCGCVTLSWMPFAVSFSARRKKIEYTRDPFRPPCDLPHPASIGGV